MSGIAVQADLGIALGDLGDKSQSILDALKGMDRKAKPTYTSRSASIFGAKPAGTVLDLGSPAVGRIWNVRSVTVIGDDPFTVPVGATLFAMFFGDPANVGLSQLKLTNVPIPSTQYQSNNALWCHSNENIAIMMNGALTAGHQIVVNCEIAEWRIGEITQGRGY